MVKPMGLVSDQALEAGTWPTHGPRHQMAQAELSV